MCVVEFRLFLLCFICNSPTVRLQQVTPASKKWKSSHCSIVTVVVPVVLRTTVIPAKTALVAYRYRHDQSMDDRSISHNLRGGERKNGAPGDTRPSVPSCALVSAGCFRYETQHGAGHFTVLIGVVCLCLCGLTTWNLPALFNHRAGLRATHVFSVGLGCYYYITILEIMCLNITYIIYIYMNSFLDRTNSRTHHHMNDTGVSL